MGGAGRGGTAYGGTLTPDPEPGRGKWTDEQIAQGIRRGNRPDGRQLSPAMPWMNFARLSEHDARSIVAFLHTVPAVSHPVPAPVPARQTAAGSALSFPPPPAWGAPEAPPPHHFDRAAWAGVLSAA